MGKKELLEDELLEEDVVTLTLDDDTEVHCAVIGIFEAGGRDYIALLPEDGPDAESGQVYLYRYSEDGDEEPVLENIVDDEEFGIASDAFDDMINNMEFDELAE